MLSLKNRAKLYNQAYPDYPPLVCNDRWLHGFWIMGNTYQSTTGYHGEYPRTYLERIMTLFPDTENILHLFSGSLDHTVKGIRFDINPSIKPDVVGNSSKLSTYFPPNKFDLILADPPYTLEDADHYGYPMINRAKVIKECTTIIKPGKFLVWLDQICPIYSGDITLIGAIGILQSTNHRVRAAFVFRKIPSWVYNV